MQLTKYLLGLALCLMTALPVMAQNEKGTIRGTVFDNENGEPLIFTNVYLEGTTYGTATDINGFFAIPNIPLGTYTLTTTSIGFDTIQVKIVLEKDGQIITQNLFNEKSSVQIGEVSISAEKEEKRTEVKISTTTVTPAKINQIPSVGGEADIAQYMQVLPGVVFTGDQGGQLYIRGGSPVQTKVLMDGLIIYNPFHSIGLFSVFETDALRSVDVYTGGYGAEYGGRISAILDIKTKDGNKKRFAGKVSGSPFLVKAIIEAPLMKLKANGSSASVLFSTKQSFLDRVSPKLYPYVNDGDGIPFSFNDYYGKFSYNASNGSKFSLFGFHYKDEALFQNAAEFEWNSLGIGANYVIVPGNSKTLISGIIGYSNYDIELREGDEPPRMSSVGGFNFNMDFKYFLTNGDLSYGFGVNGFGTDFSFFNSLNLEVEQDQSTTELGMYVRYRKLFGKSFVFEPGLRVDYYASLGNFAAEPRLAMKVNITDKVRVKVASGIYSQNLISSKSDRDVVDLFTGYLSGPEETLIRPNGEESNTKLQRAFHLVGGLEYDITDNLEIQIEPYYKNFMQLINLNRAKLFAEDSDYQIETGEAYGLDVVVNFTWKQLYLYGSYSLSMVERFNGDQTYNPHYDRRHNLNMVASIRFGKTKAFEASLRWNMGTGFPFTRTQGFYEDIDLATAGIGVDLQTANGDLGILYEDQINLGRLPTYHRLDASLKYNIPTLSNAMIDIIVSVTNIYDRDNIFYFDRVRFTRVDQLPILPSLTLSVSF